MLLLLNCLQGIGLETVLHHPVSSCPERHLSPMTGQAMLQELSIIVQGSAGRSLPGVLTTARNHATALVILTLPILVCHSSHICCGCAAIL